MKRLRIPGGSRSGIVKIYSEMLYIYKHNFGKYIYNYQSSIQGTLVTRLLIDTVQKRLDQLIYRTKKEDIKEKEKTVQQIMDEMFGDPINEMNEITKNIRRK